MQKGRKQKKEESNDLNLNILYRMPYTIKKLSTGKYRVKNKQTGKVHAKGTTKTKAEKQVKLLSMIDKKKKKK